MVLYMSDIGRTTYTVYSVVQNLNTSYLVLIVFGNLTSNSIRHLSAQTLAILMSEQLEDVATAIHADNHTCSLWMVPSLFLSRFIQAFPRGI